MRNYIILNGKNSNTISGLLVSSLPPISKPKIRANIEAIDGVDGDTITKLGYSAYNKDFEISLSYNYDIDEVIQYFNSEGIVTFSNEPNKYYKYTILEQIDFEKLIRFKKAKIKMHVQPFKYSTEEQPIKKVMQENLFDLNFTTTANGITSKANKSNLTLNGTNEDSADIFNTIDTHEIPLEAGTYTISARIISGSYSAINDTEAQIWVYSHYTDIMRLISTDNDFTNSATFTLTEPDRLYLIGWTWGDKITFNNLVIDFKLVTGSEVITDTLEVTNNGNIYSKPIINIQGTGIIHLYLNEQQLFVIDLSEETEITLNIDEMNAYNNETKQLKNRLVTGNYDNFRLIPGINTISWNGQINSLEISNYSRWI
jgi:phage-related protein